MTARQVWEGMLTELSKVNAPSMLLQDFNYFFNKAINQYINKRYNIYDVNQQTTDDLRVLKSEAVLTPEKSTLGSKYSKDVMYEVTFPGDYLHLLNCICVFKLKTNYKCYNEGDYVQFPAKRLTSDSWSEIIDNYYMRPLPQRPYYYIHNVNTSVEEPTNLYNLRTHKGTDQNSGKIINNPHGKTITINYKNYVLNPIKGTYSQFEFPQDLLDELKDDLIKVGAPETFNQDSSNFGLYFVKYGMYNQLNNEEKSGFDIYLKSNGRDYPEARFSVSIDGDVLVEANDSLFDEDDTNLIIKEGVVSEFPRTINLLESSHSLIDKPEYLRHSNASEVRCEIRYGRDNSVFELVEVLIDYVKSPQNIRLTQEQVDLTLDTSQIMEFPDYVCHEIINELTNLVMENVADPRLQTHPIVTQSIASPAQQQTQQPPQPRVSQTKRG